MFSQKDPRWAKEKLGTCKDTMGQSSCFITSLCNLAEVYKTSIKNPLELNYWLMRNGGYSNGCLLNSTKGAEGVNLINKGRANFTNAFPCIAETDHWKSKGVPQHFFVLGEDGKIIDPLDLKPVWKKNPYRIVSYRVFLPPVDTKVPKEVEKPANQVITTKETIPALVEAGEITKYTPMNEDLKKRLSSLAWRAGMMAVAVVLETVMQSLSGFGFPAEVTVILGLVLGEVSKAVRNSVK